MRLTIHARRRIRDALLDRRFEPIRLDLVEQNRALANAVYEAVYSEKERSLMATLPKGWLHLSASIRVRMEAVGDYDLSFGLDTYRPVINKHRHTLAQVFDRKHPLSLRKAKLEAAEATYKEERDRASSELMAALERFTTEKALLAEWPEIAEVATPFLAEPPKPQLPAVPVERLNKEYGLPPEKRKKAA